MNHPLHRRLWAAGILALATLAALMACSGSDEHATVQQPAVAPAQAAPALAPPAVGTWLVDIDAPYRPHLFVFAPPATPLGGGAMTSTNPTNVQQVNADGTPGTNDSVGEGWWRPAGAGDRIVFRFVELNAGAKTHKPAPTLMVVGVAWVTDQGALTGKVKAYYTDPKRPNQIPPADQIIEAAFTGERIDITAQDALAESLLSTLPAGGRPSPAGASATP
jgi:hypothetical protein